MAEIVVVTPSFRPDLDRCELLAESVARFASPEFRHVVIVPRSDRDPFRDRLGQHGATVLLQEDLLPSWLFRMPFGHKWQLSLRGWPVRGWMRQQVVKMAYACLAHADALLFVDSDICFVRPFDAKLVIRADGRVRLLSEPGVGDQSPHNEWYRRSSRLLGIPVKDYYGNGFIGPLATWVPEHARAVAERVEAITGTNWKTKLLHQKTMSEYILYGLYIEEVLGIDASHHFADERPNPVLQHYLGSFSDELLLEFLGRLASNHVAVLVQSKVAYSFSRYAAAIRSIWASI